MIVMVIMKGDAYKEEEDDDDDNYVNYVWDVMVIGMIMVVVMMMPMV